MSLFCNIWASVCSFKIIEDRSSQSPREVFCKKGVLRYFAKFTGNHLRQWLFFSKVADLRRFPMNFVKLFRTPFCTEHLRQLLLRRVISRHFPSEDRDSAFIIFFIIQVKTKRFPIPSNFSTDITSASLQKRQSTFPVLMHD